LIEAPKVPFICPKIINIPLLLVNFLDYFAFQRFLLFDHDYVLTKIWAAIEADWLRDSIECSLKQAKARVVNKEPLSIQLLYNTGTVHQVFFSPRCVW
jgi:hypothetical protein